MIEFARIYLAIFGILTIVGGVMGYVKKKSVPSIVAGSICGVLLVWTAVLMHAQPLQPMRNEPFIGALVISVILAGRFIPNYIEKRALIPGGLMALLSGISIVVTLLAWYKR